MSLFLGLTLADPELLLVHPFAVSGAVNGLWYQLPALPQDKVPSVRACLRCSNPQLVTLEPLKSNWSLLFPDNYLLNHHVRTSLTPLSRA